VLLHVLSQLQWHRERFKATNVKTFEDVRSVRLVLVQVANVGTFSNKLCSTVATEAYVRGGVVHLQRF